MINDAKVNFSCFYVADVIFRKEEVERELVTRTWRLKIEDQVIVIMNY